jgi:hypothetical protein
MPKFHFKLIDPRIVSDHGEHDLLDETVAQIEAIARCALRGPI